MLDKHFFALRLFKLIFIKLNKTGGKGVMSYALSISSAHLPAACTGNGAINNNNYIENCGKIKVLVDNYNSRNIYHMPAKKKDAAIFIILMIANSGLFESVCIFLLL